MKKGVQISFVISVMFLVLLMPVVSAGLLDWFKDFFKGDDLGGELRSGGGGCTTNADCGAGSVCDAVANMCTVPSANEAYGGSCMNHSDCFSGSIADNCCGSPSCTEEGTGNGVCYCWKTIDGPGGCEESCDPVCTGCQVCNGGVCQDSDEVCDDSDIDCCSSPYCNPSTSTCECGDDRDPNNCEGSGECTPSDCNDQDACTNDVCVNGNCENTAISPAPAGCGIGCTPSDCNDQDACTNDVCVNGNCENTPINCDDGLICTTDSCVNGACSNIYLTGCVSACFTLDCNDNDDCTDDSCVNGACVNTLTSPVPAGCGCTTASDCDDRDDCTIDACVAGSCENTRRNCDDGSDCTNDFCILGTCLNVLVQDCNECEEESPIASFFGSIRNFFSRIFGGSESDQEGELASLVGGEEEEEMSEEEFCADCCDEEEDECEEEDATQCGMDECCTGDEVCVAILSNPLDPFECQTPLECERKGTYQCGESGGEPFCCSTEDHPSCVPGVGCCEEDENAVPGIGCIEDPDYCEDNCLEDLEDCEDNCLEDLEDCLRTGLGGCDDIHEGCMIDCCEEDCEEKHEDDLIDCRNEFYLGICEVGADSSRSDCLRQCKPKKNLCDSKNKNCCPSPPKPKHSPCIVEEPECCESCDFYGEECDNKLDCDSCTGDNCAMEGELRQSWWDGFKSFFGWGVDDGLEGELRQGGGGDDFFDNLFEEVFKDDDGIPDDYDDGSGGVGGDDIGGDDGGSGFDDGDFDGGDDLDGKNYDSYDNPEPGRSSDYNEGYREGYDRSVHDDVKIEPGQDGFRDDGTINDIDDYLDKADFDETPFTPYDEMDDCQKALQNAGELDYLDGSLDGAKDRMQKLVDEYNDAIERGVDPPDLSSKMKSIDELKRTYAETIPSDLEAFLDRQNDLSCLDPVDDLNDLRKTSSFAVKYRKLLNLFDDFDRVSGGTAFDFAAAGDEVIQVLNRKTKSYAIMVNELEKNGKEYELALFKCQIAAENYPRCIDDVQDNCADDIDDAVSDIEREMRVQRINNAYEQCQTDHDNTVSEKEQEMVEYLIEYEQRAEEFIEGADEDDKTFFEDFLNRLRDNSPPCMPGLFFEDGFRNDNLEGIA